MQKNGLLFAKVSEQKVKGLAHRQRNEQDPHLSENASSKPICNSCVSWRGPTPPPAPFKTHSEHLRNFAIPPNTRQYAGDRQFTRLLNITREADDGSLVFKHSVAVLERVLALMTPGKTVLLANYPNPFNSETWIRYQLAEPADVTLAIYDVQGRVLRDLDLGHQAAACIITRTAQRIGMVKTRSVNLSPLDAARGIAEIADDEFNSGYSWTELDIPLNSVYYIAKQPEWDKALNTLQYAGERAFKSEKRCDTLRDSGDLVAHPRALP